jgi:excisionase family DNA binding protein
MQVEGTRMLRVKAVAEMFDVSPQTIYRAIEAGELRAVRVGSARRSVRIPADAVQAFADACAAAGESAGGVA